MYKAQENKREKINKLFDSAYNLFTKNGLKDTSIQNIVDDAGVGKGTFYLYFKDKYDIRNKLIEKTSKKLFSDAISALNKVYIDNFDDQVIFIINHDIDSLTNDKILLKFMSKDLSGGIFNTALTNIPSPDSKNESLIDFFTKKAHENNRNYSNPEMTLFTIIELAGTTCFNSIIYNIPVSIEEYKPYLYKIIRNILKEDT